MAIIGRDFKFSQLASIHMGTVYTNIEGNPTYFDLFQGHTPQLNSVTIIWPKWCIYGKSKLSTKMPIFFRNIANFIHLIDVMAAP